MWNLIFVRVHYFINCFAEFWKTNTSGIKGKKHWHQWSVYICIYLQKEKCTDQSNGLKKPLNWSKWFVSYFVPCWIFLFVLVIQPTDLWSIYGCVLSHWYPGDLSRSSALVICYLFKHVDPVFNYCWIIKWQLLKTRRMYVGLIVWTGWENSQTLYY